MQKNKHRVLVVGGIFPHYQGNSQAAEVVTCLVLQGLANCKLYEVKYICVSIGEIKRTEGAAIGKIELENLGVDFLQPVLLSEFPPKSNKLKKWLNTLILNKHNFLEPGVGQWDNIKKNLGDWSPNIVIPVWSELAMCACAGSGLPILTYCGNPPFKTFEANLKLRIKYENKFNFIDQLKNIYDHLLVRAMKKRHIAMMKKFECVAQLANNDAELYKSLGVDSVFYLQNMWPDSPLNGWQKIRNESEILKPIKIAANIGHLSATGNTHGLLSLVEEILPALKKRIGFGNFELHIYGSKNPRDWLIKSLKEDPHIKLRGFVNDINAELITCPIFLMANNRYGFKVVHTRFLHAWSLGASVVAWNDSRLGMPELVHGYNALLGSSGEEMAEHIYNLSKNIELRRFLGANGLKTLKNNFSPDIINKVIIKKINNILI